MGKGSEFDKNLRPLTPQEIEQQRGPRPRLRLRPELLASGLGADASVREVLARQSSGAGEDITVLRDAAGATAVTIPVEQYLELVTSYIKDNELSEVNLDGRVGPSDAVLSGLGVEQVNPRDTWLRIEGYDPSEP